MDIVTKYEALYDNMAHSKEVMKMHIFGNAEKWAFKEVAATNPPLAEMWLSKLEVIEWNNYLTESEAVAIGKTLINQNGESGAKWDMPTLFAELERLGLQAGEKPYYNRYALWVVMNMLYSDHANSVAEDMGFATVSEVPNEKFVMSFYRKAIEKLKDDDRPCFVRAYFGV